MPVSANTLFHFTKKDTLVKILQSGGFWPGYSLERFANVLPPESDYIEAYIPMVCFCDLKLTQISDETISKHTKYFGNYGIGFKKSWGIKNNISPVVYVHKNSVTSHTINNIIDTVNSQAGSVLSDKLVTSIGDIVKFLKPYNGRYQKGKPTAEEINYYDEREWRYIPAGQKFTAHPKKTISKVQIAKLNAELSNNPLKFRPDDIKYIILEKDHDKKEIAEAIERLQTTPAKKFDLITKIITLEEIKEDF